MNAPTALRPTVLVQVIQTGIDRYNEPQQTGPGPSLADSIAKEVIDWLTGYHWEPPTNKDHDPDQQ